MSFDILNEKELDRTIDLLLTAKTIGFSISHFPADVLLDVMIDAALQLSNELNKEGSLWKPRGNPSLQFLEKPLKFRLHEGGVRFSGVWTYTPDQLGNVAQKRTFPKSESAYSPPLSEFFRKFAASLVEMKRTHRLPKDLYSKGKKRSGNPTSKISPSTYWYLKRRKDHHRRNKRTSQH